MGFHLSISLIIYCIALSISYKIFILPAILGWINNVATGVSKFWIVVKYGNLVHTFYHVSTGNTVPLQIWFKTSNYVQHFHQINGWSDHVAIFARLLVWTIPPLLQGPPSTVCFLVRVSYSLPWKVKHHYVATSLRSMQCGVGKIAYLSQLRIWSS